MSGTSTKPRGIFLLPNLFTIGAIFSGFFSIVSAMWGDYAWAAGAIFISMVLDGLDGRVARLTNTMTPFGAEFDSMADMVSFAVAPAILGYAWGLNNLGKLGWIVAFVYTVSVALRLARFNTQLADGANKRYFQGLPCPSGAAVVSSAVWLASDYQLASPIVWTGLALITLMMAIFMVSNIRYRSFKDLELRNNVPFAVILVLVLIIALVSIDPNKVLFGLFFSYAISGPIMTVWGLHKKRQQRRIQLANQHDHKIGS